MLATLKTFRILTRHGWVLATFLFAVAATQPAWAQPPASAPEASSNRVQRLYLEAAKSWPLRSNSSAAACDFARASFDWADYATNDTQRAAIAEEGIAASRRAIAL